MHFKTVKMKLYPLTFKPIIKERIWGGTKLNSVLHKEISSTISGESWELSAVSGDVSVVENGIYEGKDLNELIQMFPIELLGKSVYDRFGTEFPLLFKFIDAQQDLSIQVHPNNELAKERHNSFGKTEMWYVMQADENARLIVGFKENSDAIEYQKHLKNKSVVSLLNEVEVKAGDVFFLETGTIHAIGAGVLIAEIQQTSDITYRVYDFDRVDAQGNLRELHTELALEAMNYNTTESQIAYKKEVNQSNKVVHCPYFRTHIIPLENNFIWQKYRDSFTVFMCTEGRFSMEIEGNKYDYQKGSTVLIPAILDKIMIEGKATLLEISI